MVLRDSLFVRNGASMPADDYEREHMRRKGQLLLADRTRFRGLMPTLGTLSGFMLAASIGTAVGAIVTGLWPFWLAAGTVAFGGGLLGSAGVLFSVLRVAVTTEELHIQYGLVGPRIPIDNIQECEVVDYDAMRYGGYGVKVRSIDGRMERAYTVPTQDNRVVRVVWRQDGATKHAVFSSEQPDAVRSAIHDAIARRAPGGAFRMRVELPEQGESEVEEHPSTGQRDRRKA
jgi:hypothetical protein